MIVERRVPPSRLEAFSDGMLAFAATLLVVSLEVPRTYAQLFDDVLGFAPFALSFAGLFFIWVAHTNLFRRYPMTDPLTVTLNGILLFTVLFYVFPLKFMASTLASRFTGQERVTIESLQELQNLFVIYSVGWTLVFTCFALLYLRAYALRENLSLNRVEAYDAVTHSRHYAAFAVVGLLSIAIAMSGIGIAFGLPGLVYMFLGLLAWWNSVVREAGREALVESVPVPSQLADTLAIDTSVGRDAAT